MGLIGTVLACVPTTVGIGYQPNETLVPMLESLIAILCIVLYILFRPRHVGIMMMNGMWFECTMHMDESLIRNFQPLIEWQKNIRRGLLTQGAILEKVSIRDMYMFGPCIGFMLMDVTVHMMIMTVR